jgi:hypothetical protein
MRGFEHGRELALAPAKKLEAIGKQQAQIMVGVGGHDFVRAPHEFFAFA